MGNISKIIIKFSGLSVWTTSVRLSGSTSQWIYIVEWIAPFVKQIADWRMKEARTEAIQRGDQSSFHIQFDGFYLTRGHYSNNSSATAHDAKNGKIIALATSLFNA